jgi:hypothetical protein
MTEPEVPMSQVSLSIDGEPAKLVHNSGLAAHIARLSPIHGSVVLIHIL